MKKMWKRFVRWIRQEAVIEGYKDAIESLNNAHEQLRLDNQQLRRTAGNYQKLLLFAERWGFDVPPPDNYVAPCKRSLEIPLLPEVVQFGEPEVQEMNSYQFEARQFHWSACLDINPVTVLPAEAIAEGFVTRFRDSLTSLIREEQFAVMNRHT